MEPCGCDIIFYGLMSDMGAEIKFCPVHEAAPAMQIKLQAAEEMARVLDKVIMTVNNAPNLAANFPSLQQQASSAWRLWEKAGKGE